MVKGFASGQRSIFAESSMQGASMTSATRRSRVKRVV
jgi:hypothetical protein